MGETRVDLHHLLEDLRDAYAGPIEETILTEMVANGLDSEASVITLNTDSSAATLTMIDNGVGMTSRQLTRYHDLGATTKSRGTGIGFAGVGIKLGLLISDEVYTESKRGRNHVATVWRLSSNRRAPWRRTTPLGLLDAAGTAVRLSVSNPLSPLLDPSFVRETLRLHFEPLFSHVFDTILAAKYPGGIRFIVNGAVLARGARSTGEDGVIDVRLPRKRKSSAFGLLQRHSTKLANDRAGLAISTFGKVILRGWDWLGVTPAEPDKVSGLVEVPALAQCLTTSKSGFLRTGTYGQQFASYRRAIQHAVSTRLAEWGMDRGREQREARRPPPQVQRELERILVDLADEFPLLPALVERLAGGQRRLPIGEAGGDQLTAAVPGPETHEATETDSQESTPDIEQSSERESPPPPAALEGIGKRRKARARYRLKVEFEKRPGDPELARIVETTVWVNESHPAYRRALATRASGYHLALATALSLARLAVEPVQEHEFVTAFMMRWGAEFQEE